MKLIDSSLKYTKITKYWDDYKQDICKGSFYNDIPDEQSSTKTNRCNKIDCSRLVHVSLYNCTGRFFTLQEK